MILVDVHHTVSHHNTVCKRHYRLLMTYQGWLAKALTNYRSYAPLLDSNIATRVIRVLGVLKSLPDDYHGVSNAWAYRMNAKIRTLTLFERAAEPTPLTTMMLEYWTNISGETLKYTNYHPRDFYITFSDIGHVYGLIVRDATDNSFHCVYSPTLNDTEANDDESEHIPNEKTYPDPYSKRYGLRSTTTDIHTLFPAFNEPVVIARMMRRKKWHDPAQNKYFGMNATEVSAEWERIRRDASSKGTAMHRNLELCYNGLEHDTTSKEYQLFLAFERACVIGKLKPFRTEWIMYDEMLHLCGSADIIFEYLNDMALEYYDPILNPTPRKKHLVMGDYKRSKAINYAPFMSHDADADEAKEWYGCVPCTAMLSNCNFVYYACQMCYYKEYLEANYEVIIDEMFLIILHPQQLTYLKIDIRAEQMAPFMPAIFQHRFNSLK